LHLVGDLLESLYNVRDCTKEKDTLQELKILELILLLKLSMLRESKQG